MGYRLKEPRPPKPRRNLVDLSTPMKFFVHNGTIGHFAIPCWYQEVFRPRPTEIHDRMLHDHFGWPAPDHVDRSCQVRIPHCHTHHEIYHHGHDFLHHRPLYHQPYFVCHLHLDPDHCNHKGGCKGCRHYLDARTVFPIHLDDEGYTTFDMVIVDHRGEVVSDQVIARSAEVDEFEDWVIRVDVSPLVSDAILHPRHFFFTLYGNASEIQDTKIDAITGETKTRTWPARRDVVTIGEIIVLPSALQLSTQEEG